jgi:hypothetical protein
MASLAAGQPKPAIREPTEIVFLPVSKPAIREPEIEKQKRPPGCVRRGVSRLVRKRNNQTRRKEARHRASYTPVALEGAAPVLREATAEQAAQWAAIDRDDLV